MRLVMQHAYVGPWYQPCRCTPTVSQTEYCLPWRLQQEQICRTYIHHARPTNKVVNHALTCLTTANTSLCRRKNVRRKLNAMALEFHGKNVLLVDGILPASAFTWILLIMLRFRFYCQRYHIKRNHPNGSRCRSQKGVLCIMCSSH